MKIIDGSEIFKSNATTVIETSVKVADLDILYSVIDIVKEYSKRFNGGNIIRIPNKLIVH